MQCYVQSGIGFWTLNSGLQGFGLQADSANLASNVLLTPKTVVELLTAKLRFALAVLFASLVLRVQRNS